MSLAYDHPATITPLAEHLGAEARPSLAAQDGARIVEFLRAQADEGRLPWVNGAEIARALWPDLAEHRMDAAKRKIRAAVEVNLHIVSAPGSHGYALRDRVSPEEDYALACARFSQAIVMLKKAHRAKKAAKARMTAPLPPPEELREILGGQSTPDAQRPTPNAQGEAALSPSPSPSLP